MTIIAENKYARIEVWDLSVTTGNRVELRPHVIQWTKARHLGVSFVDSITRPVDDQAKR